MHQVNNTQTLTSLAMLKVDIDQQHRNYVDYVTPFVVDVLHAGGFDIISDVRVADQLLVRFGLKVPTKAVQHVLRRLQRKGHITNQNGAFILSDSLPLSNLESTRTTAQMHINIVVKAVVAEAKANGAEWSEDQATNAITSFLGKFTVDCLRTYVFNTALPNIPKSKSSEQYIVGRFLRSAHEANDVAFQSFIVLVKGLMYSNALLCPDLESLEKKFQNITFYLDTPLLLNILGLQGDELKRAAIELVEMLVRLKGSIAAFAHTINEAQTVLSAAASNFNNPRATGRVIEEARRSGVQLSDLILVRDSIDERLKKFGIKTLPTPDYVEEFQIDERAFESALSEEIYYKGATALFNDINSIRSIYALRRGKQPVRLEDSVAVFVTPNSGIAKTAFQLGKDHNATREVSSVITAYSLANIAWLKSPVEAPNIPIIETMAMCYAALDPSPELFKRYVHEMNRLLDSGEISVRDHEILRLSPSARDELMELTLGDEHALTVSSIRSILENVKTTILSEQQKNHDATLLTLAQAHAEEAAQRSERERILIMKLAESESATRAAVNEIKSMKGDNVAKRERRRHGLKRIAHFIATGAILIVIPVLLIGAFAGSGLVSVGNNPSPLIKYGMLMTVAVAACWGVYSWHTGATVRSLSDRLESALTRQMLSWFGLEGDN